MLLDYLTLNCCPVYWETTLTSLNQNAEQVTAELLSNNKTITLTCEWVIGADGAHSTVRKQLDIAFTGDTYQHNFYLADVKLQNKELADGLVHLFFLKAVLQVFSRCRRRAVTALLAACRISLIQDKALTIDDILPDLNAITHAKIDISETFWFTTYRLHHRMAAAFRKQRCFLTGDAAHIHSPVGGQGMNTGLQDAYNLAWKLAYVLKKQVRTAILDTYAAERMPVARDLLNTTDRVFSLVMSKNWLLSAVKTTLLPFTLKTVWKKKSFREFFFRRVSQISISYRDSALSLNITQATKIKAGDRLPYLKVFDEKKQEETDLHAWCSKPGFTLIVLGKLPEPELFKLAKWITQTYPSLLNFFYLPPSAKNQHVFDKLEVKNKRAKSLIVRPDMHIGFINDAVDMVLMDNYLKNVVGVV